MSINTRSARFLLLSALLVVAVSLPMAAQTTRPFLTAGPSPGVPPGHDQTAPLQCRGAISQITDIGFEAVKTSGFNWSNPVGGGEGKRFDPTPVLTTRVNLQSGCLNAHFSAIVGSAQTYPGVSPITMFQVTLTPAVAGGVPRHMYGHYETPYGIYAPSVAVEAEKDVDTFGSNFFQTIGSGPNDVPPGVYIVDVWWAGGPAAPGGAIGAAFVLKLYQ